MMYVSSSRLISCNSEDTVMEVPDGIKYICSEAFKNCSKLVKVIIPNSVTGVSKSAFLGCGKLKQIEFRGTKEDWDKIGIENLGRCSIEFIEV